MLVDGLGVNRYSIYAEFGDEQSLFDAALERYSEEVIDRRFGPLEARDAGFVQRYFERLSRAFGAALGNARRNGELRDAVYVGEEAEFLTASVLGLFVMLRATAPTAAIEAAARVAVEHVESLQLGEPVALPPARSEAVKPG